MNSDAVPVLGACLTSVESHLHRTHAAVALTRCGEAGVKALIVATASNLEEVRFRAAAMLAQKGEPSSLAAQVRVFIEALSSKANGRAGQAYSHLNTVSRQRLIGVVRAEQEQLAPLLRAAIRSAAAPLYREFALKLLAKLK